MKYQIGFIFSKSDLKYHMEDYSKKSNLLFVTGMVGLESPPFLEKYLKNINQSFCHKIG